MSNEVVNVAELKKEINKIYQSYLIKGIFYDEPLEEVIEAIKKLKFAVSEENAIYRPQWIERKYSTTLDPCCYDYKCSICGHLEEFPHITCPKCKTTIDEVVTIKNTIQRLV